MKRLKKFVVLFLVMAMALAVAPARSAYAANEPEDDGLVLNKTYDPETGMLTLETYVTGSTVTTHSEERTALDIVLVLDLSGSMNDTIPNTYVYKAGDRQGYSYTDLRNQTLYYKDGDQYYQVERYSSSSGRTTYYSLRYVKDGTTYYLSPSGPVTERFSRTDYNDDIWTGVLYSRSQATKLDILKNAVKSFIDIIDADEQANNAGHRISIVTFGSSASTKQELRPVKGNAAAMKTIVDGFTAPWNAYTNSGAGMASANTIINGIDKERESSKIVIMYTDGVPCTSGDGKTFQSTVANNAIINSNTIKKNASVYTIGTFGGSPSTNTINYMKYVSSNYPNAASMTSAGQKESSAYYHTADSDEELENIFSTIAHDSIEAVVRKDLTESSVVLDEISQYFDLPENAKVEDIKVYYLEQTGSDGTNPTFGTTKTEVKNGIALNGKEITVTGFDFGKYYVDKTSKDGFNGNEGGNTYKGRKLVMEIPIEDNGTGFGTVPTNTGRSGVYASADDVKNNKPVKPFPIPNDTFPYFAVHHSSDGTENKIRLSELTDGKYDLTAAVKNGHLYGGYYHYDSGKVGDPYEASGLALEPADRTTYYLKEVPVTYLRPNNLTLSSKNVKYTWMLTTIDDLQYKLVGFDVDGKDVNSGSKIGSPLTDNDFSKDSLDDMNAICETISVEMSYGKSYSYGVKNVSKNETGYIACLRFADLGTFIGNEKGFTVRPYFVTPDNVKVYGDKIRTLVFTQENLTETGGNQYTENPTKSDADIALSCEAYTAPKALRSYAPLLMSPVKALDPNEAEIPVAIPEEPAETEAAKPTEVQPEETKAAEVTEVQPEETKAAETTEVQPEETKAAETTEAQPEETKAAETTEAQPEETKAAETTEAQPEETKAAETTEAQPEETKAAETTEAQPEETEAVQESAEASAEENEEPAAPTSFIGKLLKKIGDFFAGIFGIFK